MFPVYEVACGASMALTAFLFQRSWQQRFTPTSGTVVSHRSTEQIALALVILAVSGSLLFCLIVNLLIGDTGLLSARASTSDMVMGLFFGGLLGLGGLRSRVLLHDALTQVVTLEEGGLRLWQTNGQARLPWSDIDHMNEGSLTAWIIRPGKNGDSRRNIRLACALDLLYLRPIAKQHGVRVLLRG